MFRIKSLLLYSKCKVFANVIKHYFYGTNPYYDISYPFLHVNLSQIEAMESSKPYRPKEKWQKAGSFVS